MNDEEAKVCYNCFCLHPATHEFWGFCKGLPHTCKIYANAYREANKDKISARDAAYRARNKDNISTRQAAYHARNKDKISARHAAYRGVNREKIVAYNQTNWAKITVLSSKRADRDRGRYVEEDYITEDFLKHVWEEQEQMCYHCKNVMTAGVGVNRSTTPNAVTVERLNNAIGHTQSNCVLCCRKCQGVTRTRGYTPP